VQDIDQSNLLSLGKSFFELLLIKHIFQIALDIEHRAEDYDNCNALVLPAEKRKTKNVDKKVTTTRLLSKKRRKQLEKVVERKKKKLQVPLFHFA
jgi:hypothetical protein